MAYVQEKSGASSLQELSGATLSPLPELPRHVGESKMLDVVATYLVSQHFMPIPSHGMTVHGKFIDGSRTGRRFLGPDDSILDVTPHTVTYRSEPGAAGRPIGLERFWDNLSKHESIATAASPG